MTTHTAQPGRNGARHFLRPPLTFKRYAVLALAALLLCLPKRAAAHSSGAGPECGGCHNGGKVPTVTITPDVTTINPGQLVNLTISVSTTNGNTAGFYLGANVGKFSIVDSGTKAYGDTGLGVTHSTPRKGSGSAITFLVAWTAPATAGGVNFGVWANSANGDGRSGGDGEGTAYYSVAFGCAGTKYFRDYDGDGFGGGAEYVVSCSRPQGYGLEAGDCNDSDPQVFPGAPEVCDGSDNNCDGQADEGLALNIYCTDADGDGHGASGKATETGCAPRTGFGLCDDDCNDNDATIHPGATEICNNKDDNCDQRIDENARMECGVGWCARYAEGCTSKCTPGQPRAEQCNDFDDDCDGVIDNGTAVELCGDPLLECAKGVCLPRGTVVAAGGAGSGGGAVSGGASAADRGGTSSIGGGGAGATVGPANAGGFPSPAPDSSSAKCSLGHRLPREPDLAWALLLGLGALLRRSRRNAGARPSTLS